MRNANDDAVAEAPEPDDDASAVYSSAASRRISRQKMIIIGVVGLLALFGLTVFVTDQVTDARDETSQAGGPPAAAPAPGNAGRSATPHTRAQSKDPTTTAADARASTAAERVKAARSAAAKAGVRVQRPVPNTGVANVSEADVTTSMVRRGSETIKVASARKDLTGYRELAWIVDSGHRAVGNSECTSKIRLSNNIEARERPTLLLCWRTSPTRSVYTLAVKPGGRPSAAASVAAIDKQWAKLG
ncbi:hypothetical protein [Actinoplanes sp. NPDC049118]|uniref:hypothetical protein n=1 Tax=Actinoplanes sp. NPDC049118 TaxID=3155769 RepID=UPI0033F17560